MSDMTHILAKIGSGDRLAAEQLLPLVYEELRRLAAVKLAHEKPGDTKDRQPSVAACKGLCNGQGGLNHHPRDYCKSAPDAADR